MKDNMGRRDGRHANSDSEISHVSRSFFRSSKKRKLSCTNHR